VLVSAMSLHAIVTDAMTVAQMKALAGKERCKGASRKGELLYGVLLALGERGEKGVESLPVAAQSKLRASPVAQRELKRTQLAASECATWRDLVSVLEYFPPSILLHVLNEEMTVAQMKALAGKERSQGGSVKDELVYGVLLALAMRGPKSFSDLPVSAKTRIEAAPAALEWVKLLERADTAFLADITTGLSFRALLCKPRGGDGGDGEDDDDDKNVDDDDDEEEEEEGDDEDEESEGEGEDPGQEPSKAQMAANAKVAELEAMLAAAKAEAAEVSTDGTARTKSRVGAGTARSAKKKLDFGDGVRAERKSATATVTPASDGTSNAEAAAARVIAPSVSRGVLLLEVLFTFFLPMAIIAAVVLTDTMPGQPGDDAKLHRLAR